MQGQLGLMAASPLPRLEAIRKSFRAMPDDGEGLRSKDTPAAAVPVRLEPIDQTVKQFVQSVRVLLDPERGFMLVFEMTDPDGEQTVIRFTKLKANNGLADDALTLDAPAGVKVVRPLDGAESLQR